MSTACRTGASVWPQGGSGSGDDSAYYAHSDLQSAISHEPEGSGANLWPTQGPENNGGTSGVPLDWSQHETSSMLTSSKPMLISAAEHKTGYSMFRFCDLCLFPKDRSAFYEYAE
ncbi:unnamed protein product [Echinostoma caproni]|uniref:Uncharacterized protein n=1 Tax=Echinostoma caproni TaxID=27848 RepID=A0A3P8L279_9TREM|nr:unnamed protein product [Echinostoma caproni]